MAIDFADLKETLDLIGQLGDIKKQYARVCEVEEDVKDEISNKIAFSDMESFLTGYERGKKLKGINYDYYCESVYDDINFMNDCLASRYIGIFNAYKDYFFEFAKDTTEKANERKTKYSKYGNHEPKGGIGQHRYTVMVWKKEPEDPDWIYCKDCPFDVYSKHRHEFEFRLCMLLSQTGKLDDELVKAIYLYIALDNWKRRLEKRAKIEDINLTGADVTRGIVETPKLAESAPSSNDVELTVEERGKVYTPRAQKFLMKAKRDKYLTVTGKDKYEWLLVKKGKKGHIVSLCFFLVVAYDDQDNPPYGLLERMFDVKNLSQSAHQMKNQPYYKYYLRDPLRTRKNTIIPKWYDKLDLDNYND